MGVRKQSRGKLVMYLPTTVVLPNQTVMSISFHAEIAFLEHYCKIILNVPYHQAMPK